jgi:zona occludens toxin (predicted ATPase)
MELHQCLGWVESQSETPILVVLSALLRNFYWYGCSDVSRAAETAADTSSQQPAASRQAAAASQKQHGSGSTPKAAASCSRLKHCDHNRTPVSRMYDLRLRIRYS